MTAKIRRLAAGVATVLACLLLVFHWLPGRQVRLHQKHFQTAVENRDWKRVADFIAPDYRDAWNPDREALRAQLPLAFQDFLACSILGDESALGRRGDTVIFRARLRLVGSGGPVAQMVMDAVATLTQPFDFAWRRQSWRPWDWKLVFVEQPELAGFVPPADGPTP